MHPQAYFAVLKKRAEIAAARDLVGD